MTTTAIGRGMTAAATTSRRLFHTRRGSRHLSPTLTCGSVINDKGRDRSGGLSSSVQILPPLRPRCTRIRRWQRQERRILRPLLLPCRSRHLSTPTHSNLPPAVTGEVDPTTSQYNDNIGRPRGEGGMMMWRPLVWCLHKTVDMEYLLEMKGWARDHVGCDEEQKKKTKENIRRRKSSGANSGQCSLWGLNE
uniref:Uncharacterized protein n=1 Tax=Oryza rufipogon TaxID=4529 RepID=A0A0E0NKY2_ORYRU